MLSIVHEVLIVPVICMHWRPSSVKGQKKEVCVHLAAGESANIEIHGDTHIYHS